MPKIILSDFQTAANEKYADFEVHLPGGEVILFVPAIRLPKAKRTELSHALDVQARAAVDDGTDIYDLYRDAFRITEKAPGNYDKLAAVVGDDPAVWQDLFIEFQEITQPGEA
jgi:Mycobacteriophage tail assembly protein